MFVYGSVPYNSFSERLGIVKKLKQEFKKVRITVLDDVVLYEAKVNRVHI
jgi:hypothetical protein